ncbi:MAG: hypothetical protein NTU62_16800 [Spirochaetes bacterium]|nr:hypothetical protein [Spirochaetota bacterium]
MKRPSIRRIVLLPLIAVVAVLLASCATVNRLEHLRLDNPALASVLEPPPPPSLDTWYDLRIDTGNPIGTVLRVGSSIVLAAEAEKAAERMREALSEIDVPAMVLEESSARCTRALGANRVDDTRDADFVLDLEIEEYGIDAPSWGAAVSLDLNVTVRLYERRSRDLVWRRHISVAQQASPDVFGLPSAAETIFTAAMLAALSTEEMARGFEYLAHYAARTVGDTLERDLWKARGGW